jgi:hypothetical protein
MTKGTPHGYAAHDALRKAYAAGRIVFITDSKILARPGSPLYSALEVFVPPVVLMASSLALLFAFGLVEWLASLVAVVLYQLYAAPLIIAWRVHRRAVAAALNNAHNMQILWQMGGIGIALKDWPERNCTGPKGDWRAFCGEFLVVPEAAEH